MALEQFAVEFIANFSEFKKNVGILAKSVGNISKSVDKTNKKFVILAKLLKLTEFNNKFLEGLISASEGIDKMAKGIKLLVSGDLSKFNKGIQLIAEGLLNIDKAVLGMLKSFSKVLRRLKLLLFFAKFRSDLGPIPKILGSIINKLIEFVDIAEKGMKKVAVKVEEVNKKVDESESKITGLLKAMRTLAFNILKTGGILFGMALIIAKMSGMAITLRNLTTILTGMATIFRAVVPASLARFANSMRFSTIGLNRLVVGFESAVKHGSRFDRLILKMTGREGLRKFEAILGKRVRPETIRTAEQIKRLTKEWGHFQKRAAATSSTLGQTGRMFHAAAEGEAAMLGGLGKLGVKMGFAAGTAAVLTGTLGALDNTAARVMGTISAGALGLSILVISLTHVIGQFATAIGTGILGVLQRSIAVFTEARRETFRFNIAVLALQRSIGDTAPTLKEWTGFVDEIVASTAIARAELLGATALWMDSARAMRLNVDEMKKVLRAGVDLTSQGASIQEVMTLLTTAFTSNGAAARRLSIDMRIAVLTENEYFLSLNKTWESLTLRQQAQVKFNEFMRQSAIFAGAAVSQTNDWTGAIQRLHNRWELLSISQGRALAKVFLPMLQVVSDLVEKFRIFGERTRELSTTLLAFTGVGFIVLGFFARWSAIIFGLILGFKALSFVLLKYKGIDLAKTVKQSVLGMLGLTKTTATATNVMRRFVKILIVDTARAFGVVASRFAIFLGLLIKAPFIILKAAATVHILRLAVVLLGKTLLIGGIILAAISAIKGLYNWLTKTADGGKILAASLTVLKAVLVAAKNAVGASFIIMQAISALIQATFFLAVEIAITVLMKLWDVIKLFLPTGTGGRVLAFFVTLATKIIAFGATIKRLLLGVRKLFVDTAKGFREQIKLAEANLKIAKLTTAERLKAVVHIKLLKAQAVLWEKMAVLTGANVVKQVALNKAAGKFQQIVTSWKTAFDRFRTTFVEGLNDWVQDFKDAGNGIKDFALQTADAMAEGFSNLFFNTMTGKITDLREAWNSLLKGMARSVSDFLGKRVVFEIFTKILGLPGTKGAQAAAEKQDKAADKQVQASGTMDSAANQISAVFSRATGQPITAGTPLPLPGTPGGPAGPPAPGGSVQQQTTGILQTIKQKIIGMFSAIRGFLSKLFTGQRPVSTALGGFASRVGGGGGFLSTALGAVARFLPFQEGGIVNLADNVAGIAKQPTFAAIAETGQAEAIVPLSKFSELIKPTVINISTIDSKSAAQWFQDNKELVLGTLFSNRSNVISKLSPISRGPF